MIKALFACLSTILFVLILRKLALKVGLVDYPGGRKKHAGLVPLVGGIAMLLAFFLIFVMAFPYFAKYKAFLIGLALLGVVGVIDDVDELSARTKFMFQACAAVLMTSWGEVYLQNLGNIVGTGPILLKNFGIPLTLFAVVAVINAINMFDGLDGLAASLSMAIFVWLIVLAALLGLSNAANILGILLGCVAGFLLFNWPAKTGQALSKRHIFMGDAGSMMLGFSIAWFCVEISQRSVNESTTPFAPAVVMLWIVGVILIDMLCVTLRRFIKGKSPFVADRTHLHHFLQRAGHSDRAVVLILLSCNLLLGACGVLAWYCGVSETVMFLTFIAITAAYLLAMHYPRRLLRVLRAIRLPGNI